MNETNHTRKKTGQNDSFRNRKGNFGKNGNSFIYQQNSFQEGKKKKKKKKKQTQQEGIKGNLHEESSLGRSRKAEKDQHMGWPRVLKGIVHDKKEWRGGRGVAIS